MTPTPTRYHVLASNLLYASFLLTIPINYFTKQGYFEQNMSSSTHMMLIVVTPLLLGWYFLIRLGKRWAMILFVANFILILVLTAWRPEQMILKSFTTPLRALNYVWQMISEVATVVLLLLSLFNRPPQPALAPEA